MTISTPTPPAPAAARLWQFVARPHPSLTEVGDRRRAQLLVAVALGLAVADLLGFVASIAVGAPLQNDLTLLGLTLACLLAYVLGRTRWLSLGSAVLVTSLSVAAYVLVLLGSTNPIRSLNSTIPVALVLGSVLLSVRGLSLLVIGNTLATSLLPLWLDTLSFADASQVGGNFFTIGVLLIIAALFRNALERARLQELRATNSELQDIRANLEQRVAERTHSAEVARAEADAARQKAEAASQSLEAQAWLTASQVQLSQAMRGDQALSDLARQITRQVCVCLEAQMGALFLHDEDGFAWIGGYTDLPDDPGHLRFAPGQGLVGQAALQNRRQLIAEVPPDYRPLISGLGDAVPRQILIQPLAYGGEVMAVLELATLGQFTPRHIEFLDQSAESIAIALRSAQTRQRVEALLVETRDQAEELQAQEEELRAVNEELQAQAENLKRLAW